MPEIRTDVWITNAASPEQLLPYLGKHLVALPFGREGEKASGQFISLDPTAETVALRDYSTGIVTELPMFTTHFRYSTTIESPFAGLAVGMIRRFEWHHDHYGNPLALPVSYLGTVDKVAANAVHLWVRDTTHQAGGWWAHIKADDAAKHSIRPPSAAAPAE
ncbi:hypothetical protein [Streptomyces sp. NPDC056061]|uniref:hypothetical protein n=1 Tax=Streptomyces sp. NPDC056061 TaxID=3345700 RepID=UPI0035DBED82